MLTRIVVAVALAVVAVLVATSPATAQAPVSCSWTDNPIVAGGTLIKAQHLNEIRSCLDSILANWPAVGLPPPPPPPGGADVSIHNVRRHPSPGRCGPLDPVRCALQNRTLPCRVQRPGVPPGRFFSDCSESFFDLDAGEQQDGLVIPSICGSDVQWTHFVIQSPADRSCTGCVRYNFADVPVGRAAPAQTLNAERASEILD